MQKGDRNALLTNARWVGHDDVCENRIFFGTDNSFVNNCACGEPLGMADVTEFYSYNDKDKTLDLYDSDGETLESGKILFLDESYLVVELWDDVYVYENKQGHVPTVYEKAKKCVFDEATKPCLAVLKFEDNVLTIASHDYDGDTPDLFEKWELTASEDINFMVVSVTDNKGDVQVQCFIPNEEDCRYIGEYYTCGYFEFDENGQVKSVIFYGELIIQ